jgi:hypothetical protein
LLLIPLQLYGIGISPFDFAQGRLCGLPLSRFAGSLTPAARLKLETQPAELLK